MDLRDAIERNELELHYQPIIDLRRNAITGFEALARWRHPVKGMVPPAVFIPVAEDSGLILPIGEWALQEACRQAAHWPDDLKIAVNLSPVQILAPNLLETVQRALAESGLAPHRLEIEITERIIHGGHRAHAVDPAPAQGYRRVHRDGRFRHRLFVAQLSAAASRSTRSRSTAPSCRTSPRAPSMS